MNTVVTNLLRFLVISSISSVVVVIIQRSSPCLNLLPPGPANPNKEELAAPVAVGSKVTAHHQVAAADDDTSKLSELLRRAAMEDGKTVILAFTNEAWTAPGSLTDLFLESFSAGVKTEALLRHLILVTMDGTAWERCQRVHSLCYALDVGGANFTSEQRYMGTDYLDMVWRRVRFQGRVLELGHSFLLTDVDIVWFRSPLLRVPVAADIAMACDRFRGDNPYDLVDKGANAGLVYARASRRTAEFYRVWYEARNLFPGRKTQDVFDKIKHQLTARLGVTLQFVDTAYLGTFCDRRTKEKRDFNKLCTFHANCVLGLNNKVHKLRAVLNEWKQFKADANNNSLLA